MGRQHRLAWRRPAWSGRLVYAIGSAVVGVFLAVFSRFRVARLRGQRKVANNLPDGPIIVIANHTSYLDGLLLAIVARRMGRTLRMLATAGVFRAPIVGGLARRVGFIPVERRGPDPAAALGPALDALAAGEAVGLFPEGRISRDPQQWPERARTGMVRLALRSGAPVVPIAMVGAHRVIPRRRILSRVMLNAVLRPEVAVVVGTPIDVVALVPPAAQDAGPEDVPELRAVTDQVMGELVALVERLRASTAPDPVGVERSS
ncbi:MAG: lysophospholipid acyltransferase family protein [Actinomycetota bacterium]